MVLRETCRGSDKGACRDGVKGGWLGGEKVSNLKVSKR